jgi:hypothetical protein
MSDLKKSQSEFQEEARVCSLVSSGNPEDRELAEELAEDSEYICLNCKQTASDDKKLCSPALK